jgi:hypothetical protein
MKERQMEIDVETDPDTLFDLFGDDAASFAELVDEIAFPRQVHILTKCVSQRSCPGLCPRTSSSRRGLAHSHGRS